MERIDVRVWWSTGTGDGDDYEDSVELSEDAIAAIKKAGTRDLRAINNSECQKACDQLLAVFADESQEYDEEYQEYLEECEENEEEPECYVDWFENSGNYVGVKLKDDLD